MLSFLRSISNIWVLNFQDQRDADGAGVCKEDLSFWKTCKPVVAIEFWTVGDIGLIAILAILYSRVSKKSSIAYQVGRVVNKAICLVHSYFR